ncbi:hypothetical protein EDD16DRAFT_1897071 [Pisolithus croceorrhizus]|nr:hypothetical protein EDD16DRAFT_1897071 [Pisolithus croceorrhizus]KAI6134246.1 hypothetical protein EV401DRAFT_1341502 [Pisolithus croceorrhizus]
MPTAHRIPENSAVHGFLSKCDPKVEIYVTHVDTSSPTHRKGRFFTLLGVNLSFTFLLLRRIYSGFYRYGVLFAISKAVPSLSSNVPAPTLGWALLGNILLDLFIFTIFLPIVLDFAKGLAMLRLRYGFPKAEVVFRKPTTTTMVNIAVEAPQKKDAFLKDLLQRAVDPEEIKQMNFGMPWEEWTYDYKAMAAANEANKNGSIKSQTWDLSTWIKVKPGWSVIQHNGEVDYQTRLEMMEKLKDKLQEMDKEHVFLQMTEVIRTRTVYTNGAPQPMPAEVDDIISGIFKSNDLDFGEIMRDISMDIPPSFVSGSKDD